MRLDKREILNRLPISSIIQELLPDAKPSGNGKMLSRCPWPEGHSNGDANPSFIIHIEDGGFVCQGCHKKGSLFDLYGHFHGLDFKGALHALAERAGMTAGDKNTGKPIVTGKYNYGPYWKERLDYPDGHKEFRFYHGNGASGRGGEAVLYNVACLYGTDTVFFPEGEKQVDLLTSWGLPAITLDSGASSKLTPAMVQALTGKHLVLLQDNDDPGRKSMEHTAATMTGKAASIKIIVLTPDLPKGDVIDWACTSPGNNKDALLEIVKATPEWKPTKESSENRIKVVDAFEFMSLEFPPRENILAPWLPRQGLAMVYAPRGIGKTHFSLGVAYAVASGSNFLGWGAIIPRGVLFLDGEMPGASLQERIAHIAASNEKEPTAPFKIITPDLQPKGMIDLSRPEDQESLQPHLEGVDLIIVDNLSTLCRSGKESEGEGWLPVQQWALQQRAAGRSVLFIHHAGKNGEQRGTSRREDVLDTVIALKRPGDYTPDMGAAFEVNFEKARGLFGDETKPFEARLISTPDGLQEWALKPLEDSTAEKVAKLLNEGIPQYEIPDLLKISKGAVSKAKNKAKSMGLLKGVS